MKCHLVVLLKKNINVFNRIEKYYNGGVKFRLGTPAIRLDGYPNEMIAMGHLVIFPYYLPINTKAYFFYKENILSKHPVNDVLYMMFFYTFNRETFEILRISSAFYPPNASHGVVFPEGLSFN